jgi:putative phosphoribosyl transferase
MSAQFGISHEEEVIIDVGAARLAGTLAIPGEQKGIVVFAHGSGSGRHSRRNQYVASLLRESGLATLLFDLLTAEEEIVDQYTSHLRFDIHLLAGRLIGATDWLLEQASTSGLAVGYFGASTGGGAALVAAARRPKLVSAIVSRGGRPDLARESLSAVHAPTLLIVGGNDDPVIDLNEVALDKVRAPIKDFVIVPGASHLFEEPGKLDEVARLAADWFNKYLDPAAESWAD